MDDQSQEGALRSLLLINRNPRDRAVFFTALSDVYPKTICLVADDGFEAIEIIREEGVIPDYIFMELEITNGDGLYFMHELRKMKRIEDVSIILHHVDHPNTHLEELKQLGILAVYQEPYNYQGVLNVLNMYFRMDGHRMNLN